MTTDHFLPGGQPAMQQAPPPPPRRRKRLRTTNQALGRLDDIPSRTLPAPNATGVTI